MNDCRPLLLITEKCVEQLNSLPPPFIGNLIILGQWCKQNKENLDRNFIGSSVQIIPYHWDKKDKVTQDYIYLGSLFDRVLTSLVQFLNKVHGVNHSQHFWEIYLGSWLELVLGVLFDRWSIIEELKKTRILQFSMFDSPHIILSQKPNSLNDAIKLYVSNDWNHMIFQTLLRSENCFDIKHIQSMEQPQFTSAKSKPPENKYKYIWVKFLFRGMLRLYYKFTSTVSHSMLLGFKTSLQNKCFDNWLWTKFMEYCAVSKSCRNESLNENKVIPKFNLIRPEIKQESFENFENSFLSEQIIELLPDFVMDDFHALLLEAKNLPWPSNCKKYQTATGLYKDDLIRLRVALEKETNEQFKIAVFQHASGYLMNKLMSYERIETRIADIFYAWGHTANDEKIQHRAHPRLADLRSARDNSTKTIHFLIILLDWHKFSYMLNNNPVGGQVYDFCYEQAQFCKNLFSVFGKKMTIKPYPVEVGFSFKSFVSGEILKQVAKSDIDLKHLVERSKLTVCAYLSTVFLQCISNNIPVICIMSEKYFEENDNSTDIIEMLRRVNVIFDNFQDALTFLCDDNLIVENWWNKVSTQDAVIAFKREYASID